MYEHIYVLVKSRQNCYKDPMYVIFWNSTGFREFKYDIGT